MKVAKGSIVYRMKQNKMFYISVAPFLMIFLMFSLFPIVASFFLGFTKWNGVGLPEFNGIDNYIQLFKDPIFIKSIYNTIYIWFFSTLFTLGLAFILAYLVNHYIDRAKGFFRVVFLFPLLVAPALTAIMISVIFSTNAGIVNSIISLFTEGVFTYEWLRSQFWVKPLIVLIIVWRWTGYHFILYIAGLQTISKELYDAAEIDGANVFQKIMNVTLPLMTPILLVSVITATVGGIQIFDEPYVLTQGTGGINNSGVSMGMYLYQTAFEYFNFGLAAAQSFVLFLMILGITLVNARLLRNRT
ncbi:carbohydrate ABC transporter permease [Gracilibacillus alcaliphilus]|uniref:carbohydrate ABC transporter permease n=1 Tax=Gracilibacillus alcaliphilus TaxID=1401441 RepID=UPI0019583A64|nr:sugar ABC transporter permease [Gracilibacillus alcaliphilus]MBM7676189.1 ABC-type sugar transport system permease subunit [Gracilibacillus alcaliphilus]